MYIDILSDQCVHMEGGREMREGGCEGEGKEGGTEGQEGGWGG